MPFNRRRRSVKRKNYFSLLFVLFGLKKKITDNTTGTKTCIKSRLTSTLVFSCSDKRMLRNKSENLIVLSDESIPIPLILSERIGVENRTGNLKY